MAVLPAGPFRDLGVRTCADRISDVMRGCCECVRMQGGRRLDAPMHHQRTGLWPALVYAGCVGMANACYPFCWPVRICGLVNYSHPSSTKLAEACVCRSSSSDSPTASGSMSPTIAVAPTSRQTATEFLRLT